jgi:uncharacterized protein YcfL
MSRRKYALSMVVGLGVVVMAGCAKTVSNVAEVRAVAGPDGMILVRENIVVNGPWLAERLAFGEIKSRIKNEFMEVQVEVTNKLSSEQHIEYSFLWYDEAGFLVDAASSAWTPKVIYGKQTIDLNAVGPTPSVREAKLQVRRGG